MGRKYPDVNIGDRYGRLTVIDYYEDYIVPSNNHHMKRWKCLCDCGKETVVRDASLKSKETQSCGCLNLDLLIKRAKEQKPTLNEYIFNGDIVYIVMPNNPELKCLIDRKFYDKVKNIRWNYTGGKKYVTGKVGNKNVRIHQYLFDFKYKEIDHIDRNTLNNLMSNLRPCTHQENSRNAKAKNYHKRNVGKRDGYRVEIKVNYKGINFGSYKTEEEAHHIAYLKRRELFGEFAWDYKLTEEESWKVLHNE